MKQDCQHEFFAMDVCQVDQVESQEKELTSLLSNRFPIPCTPPAPTCSWLAFPILPYSFSPDGFFLKFPAIKSARYPDFGGASFEFVVGDVVEGEESVLFGLEGASEEVLDADRRERGDLGGGYWKIIALCLSRVRWVLWNIFNWFERVRYVYLIISVWILWIFLTFMVIWRVYTGIVEVGDVWLEIEEGKRRERVRKMHIHFWRRARYALGIRLYPWFAWTGELELWTDGLGCKKQRFTEASWRDSFLWSPWGSIQASWVATPWVDSVEVAGWNHVLDFSFQYECLFHALLLAISFGFGWSLVSEGELSCDEETCFCMVVCMHALEIISKSSRSYRAMWGCRRGNLETRWSNHIAPAFKRRPLLNSMTGLVHSMRNESWDETPQSSFPFHKFADQFLEYNWDTGTNRSKSHMQCKFQLEFPWSSWQILIYWVWSNRP